MLKVKIQVFATGGTFDKEYDELTGALFFKETHLGEMFSCARCLQEFRIETLVMIDSLEMQDGHREKIFQACLGSTVPHIVITHGTDSMEVTARYLGERMHLMPDKTVVLTGAMVPYKFGSSDGLFNLGSAMAFVTVLQPGVYIAMNGMHFTWDNVKKDTQKGIFVSRKKG
jgi:L-asparaginase